MIGIMYTLYTYDAWSDFLCINVADVQSVLIIVVVNMEYTELDTLVVHTIRKIPIFKEGVTAH